jgi:hypothetical protein
MGELVSKSRGYCKGGDGSGREDRSWICLTSESSSSIERSKVSLKEATSMSGEVVDGEEVCVSRSISLIILVFEPGTCEEGSEGCLLVVVVVFVPNKKEQREGKGKNY